MNTAEDMMIQERVQEEFKKRLSNPLELLKFAVDALEKADQKINELNTHINHDLMPKVEMYDVVMGTDHLIEMSAVAKVLNYRGMGRNNLFEYLKERKILRYNNEPYQSYVDAGYFKIVREAFERDGYEGIYNKTMTTQKGVNYIGKLLREDGYELNPR
jgi:anti-repressor protein